MTDSIIQTSSGSLYTRASGVFQLIEEGVNAYNDFTACIEEDQKILYRESHVLGILDEHGRNLKKNYFAFRALDGIPIEVVPRVCYRFSKILDLEEKLITVAGVLGCTHSAEMREHHQKLKNALTLIRTSMRLLHSKPF